MDSDAVYSRFIHAYSTEPWVPKNALTANQQSTLEKTPEPRRRIVTALAHHFHLLKTQAFPDTQGVVAGVITHQHLALLGLHQANFLLIKSVSIKLISRAECQLALLPICA